MKIENVKDDPEQIEYENVVFRVTKQEKYELIMLSRKEFRNIAEEMRWLINRRKQELNLFQGE